MNLKHNKDVGLSQAYDLASKSSAKTKNIIVINNSINNNIVNAGNVNDHYISENVNFNYAQHPPPIFDPNSQPKYPPGYSNTLYPAYNRSVNYYHEFWRMYLQNEVLISQMKEYVVQTKEIQARINQLETLCQELELNLLNNLKKETKKKNRRIASEIEKTHTCPYEGCNKLYGSDVSLNLHIKLKHNGGNKTEREKLARTIFLAKLNGEKVPAISLNLPPGFLDVKVQSSLMKDKSMGSGEIDGDNSSQASFDKNELSVSHLSGESDMEEDGESMKMELEPKMSDGNIKLEPTPLSNNTNHHRNNDSNHLVDGNISICSTSST
jgi:hypothetical protein